jgi:hypothetical protein
MIKMINVFVYSEWTYYINWICFNWFDATYGFNTKKTVLKIYKLMNWNVQDEQYNGKGNTRLTS